MLNLLLENAKTNAVFKKLNPVKLEIKNAFVN